MAKRKNIFAKVMVPMDKVYTSSLVFDINSFFSFYHYLAIDFASQSASFLKKFALDLNCR